MWAKACKARLVCLLYSWYQPIPVKSDLNQLQLCHAINGLDNIRTNVYKKKRPCTSMCATYWFRVISYIEGERW